MDAPCLLTVAEDTEAAEHRHTAVVATVAEAACTVAAEVVPPVVAGSAAAALPVGADSAEEAGTLPLMAAEADPGAAAEATAAVAKV